MNNPVILDFDDSVGAIQGGHVIPLQTYQEVVRFGCSLRAMRELETRLDISMPNLYGTALLGSGDFHHVSYLLIKRMVDRGPFEVVVFDNHPDNMRYPFGIHCGSWVRHVTQLPFVSHVHVVGISSSDVSWTHSWENYLRPLYLNRLTYWCVDVDTSWARKVGLSKSILRYESVAKLLDAFSDYFSHTNTAVYLSIDKDVLSKEIVKTNWDQGRLTDKDLLNAIDLLDKRLIGCDITGEVSAYRYQTAWKRWLSGLDGQAPVAETELAEWQDGQQDLNRRLLSKLHPR